LYAEALLHCAIDTSSVHTAAVQSYLTDQHAEQSRQVQLWTSALTQKISCMLFLLQC